MGDLDEEGNAVVDEELKKLARSITRKHAAGGKHAHDEDINEDDEAEDGNGSMFEDLDEPLPTPTKRSGKAKSPAKWGPACWPHEEGGCCASEQVQQELG